jgi:hypothetical protein
MLPSGESEGLFPSRMRSWAGASVTSPIKTASARKAVRVMEDLMSEIPFAAGAVFHAANGGRLFDHFQ